MKKYGKKILAGLSLLSFYSSGIFAGTFSGLDGEWRFTFVEKPYQNQTITLSSDAGVKTDLDLSVLDGDLDLYQSSAVFVHLYGDMNRPLKQLFPSPGMGFAYYKGEPVMILFSEKNGVLSADDTLRIVSYSADKIELTSSKSRDKRVLATLRRN